jgi:hypothetical protein
VGAAWPWLWPAASGAAHVTLHPYLPADVDDVAIEALEELVEQVRAVKSVEGLKPLVASMAHHRAVSRLRQHYAAIAGQERQLDFLRALNREHLERHPGELDLEARIASYELAARMQTAAKEAMDISAESEATRQLYGIDQDRTRDYGTRCLMARRLVERGVRFVQIINNGQSWDHHSGIAKALPDLCARSDQPVAALIHDLKARGLLDSTLVHWGGEMGRLPVIQNDLGKDRVGRDHNTYGFTIWLAGGGIKGGITHGETDEWSHKAVKDIVTHHDYHATVLHLFGLDYTKLIYRRAGRELSLTDRKPARVVKEILAGGVA